MGIGGSGGSVPTPRGLRPLVLTSKRYRSRPHNHTYRCSTWRYELELEVTIPGGQSPPPGDQSRGTYLPNGVGPKTAPVLAPVFRTRAPSGAMRCLIMVLKMRGNVDSSRCLLKVLRILPSSKNISKIYFCSQIYIIRSQSLFSRLDLEN